MQLNVPVKPILIGLFGIVVGIGLAVGPRHLPRPAPAPPAPAPRPDPAPPAPDIKPDWFGGRGADAPAADAPDPGPMAPTDPPAHLMGWRADGGHRALAATMPRLSRAAPALMQARDPGDTRPVLLYKAWLDLFRSYPAYPAQQIGDCVSFGHGHANDLLQCIEWAIAHPGRTPLPKDIQETDTEALYGMSREAGGLLGGQDGCYGSAAVKAMTTAGLVSRRMLGGDDGAYTGWRARQWGRTGVPASVKQMAARYKLGAAAQVSTYDELVAALRNGHPVTICTAQGFTLQRDAQGFCRAQGRWGHCMFIAGIRFDRPGACLIQSWGSGSPSGPTALDQPTFSFWAEKSAIEAILAEGDSWALSAAPRFGAGSASKGRRKLPDAWRKAA